MTKSKHTIAEYRELVARSLSADRDAAKAAKKQINNSKYATNELLSRVIFEHFPPDQAILADARRYENFLKLLDAACWGKKAIDHKDELQREAWRGLEHPDGMVRQAARRLFDTIRTTTRDSRTPLNEFAEYYIDLLNQIEKRLKEHEQHKQPSSVEKAPPSVYKTLTMLWYDIAFIPVVESRIDAPARMMELEIMPYDEPVFENELEIADYDLSDWQDNLEEYVRYEDKAVVRKHLKQREKQALKYLDWALADLRLSEHRAKIVYHATYEEPEKLGMFLEHTLELLFLNARSQEEGILIAFRYNKLARAIQYLDNNIVHVSRQGTAFSREVVEAVYCADENMKFEKVRLEEYVVGFDAAHHAIDEFVRRHIKPAVKKQEARYRKISERLNDKLEPDPIDLIEPAQIAHYLLDKLPTASYKTFLKQDAGKIAATIWKIFSDDNSWIFIPGLDNASLSDFGGWKSENGVHSSVLRYRSDIAETVSDPTIMYIVRDNDDLLSLKELRQTQRGGFGPIEVWQRKT